MKLPTKCEFNYTYDTIKTAQKLDPETVSGSAHLQGMLHAEPLIVIMDCLLQYAKVYKSRFGSVLAEDYVLGSQWLSSAKGIRGLLNGDGAFAMMRNCRTDSKDNGAVEEMFWTALNSAGFSESDL